MYKQFSALALGLLMSSAHAIQAWPDCQNAWITQAVAAGVPEVVAKDAIMPLMPRDEVLRLDRSQPEFSKGFADYYRTRVTADRAAQAQQLWRDYAPLFERIYARYGVQPQYLLAFWGLETNFGQYFGSTPTLDALATLACNGRRSEFFTQELISAIKIVDEGVIAPTHMKGSWAGAMGHTQFMPSTFLKYAVDADGDGVRDIWRNVPDALASAANYLHQIGWQGNYRWGREVLLPDGFDYRYATGKQRLSLADWRKLGLKDTQGQPLTDEPIHAALLAPTGHQGAVFLLYDNFNVIMEWNRSESYALSVGLLADVIAGQAGLIRPLMPSPALRLDEAKAVQQALANQGYNVGTIDGILGSGTRVALAQYQADHQMIADGFIDEELLKSLKVW